MWGSSSEAKTIEDMPLGDRRSMQMINIMGGAVFVNYESRSGHQGHLCFFPDPRCPATTTRRPNAVNKYQFGSVMADKL
jgi:hypothetical protein